MKLSDERILADMSELWRDIFHDSDDYISLIINDTLDLNLCAWIYNSKGIMTSMVVGIPYIFIGNSIHYKGLYLCGVCTSAEYRGQGEAVRIFDEIENRAKCAGFDFTFLIPANENLRRYYTKYLYKNMSKSTDNVVISSKKCDAKTLSNINEVESNLLDFCNEQDRQYKFRYISESDIHSGEIFDPLAKKILSKIEEGSGVYYLRHSTDQWMTVYREWLQSGHKILYVYKGGDDVTLWDIIFIKSKESEGNEAEEHPYGMIKGLREGLPSYDEFGICFMLDS